LEQLSQTRRGKMEKVKIKLLRYVVVGGYSQGKERATPGVSRRLCYLLVPFSTYTWNKD